MKRTPLRRKTPLVRSSPLPKVGTSERRKKTEARRRKQRRETDGPNGRAETLARDGHRCTAILAVGNEWLPMVELFATEDWVDKEYFVRCQATEDLAEHHINYKRSIRTTLCRPHHEYIEARLRWYRRKRGRAS